MQQIKWCLWR